MVEWVAVLGASGDYFMTATSADTCFTSSAGGETECLVQRYTSIVISYEGSSCQDMVLECVKLSHLDTLNHMSDLGPGINPHTPMLLDTLKDVVLILLNFNVAFKVEPLTFTRVMRGVEEPFGFTRHVIHIIWSQEMAPQVTVGRPSISCPLG